MNYCILINTMNLLSKPLKINKSLIVIHDKLIFFLIILDYIYEILNIELNINFILGI